MLQDNNKKILWYRIREAATIGSSLFLVFGPTFLFCATIIYGCERRYPIELFSAASCVVVAIVIVGFLLALSDSVPTGKWLIEVQGGTIVLDKETNKIVEVQNKNVVLRKSHPIFNEKYQFLTINPSQEIGITIHQLKEKKVNNIHCRLTLKIKEVNCQGFQVLFDFLVRKKMWRVDSVDGGKTEIIWQRPVRGMLYDFCNTHSFQLSELFNPMREEQQERFEIIMHSYFDPLLDESGIEITSCRFSVN